MIRVFIIAVLALGALALIAHSLPVAVPADVMEGVWEGPFDTYSMAGERLASTRIRLEIETTEPGVRSVRRLERYPDGRVEESSGEIHETDAELTWRMTDPEGNETVLAGRRQGPAIFWHTSDPSLGTQRSLREQVVHRAGGDLYTIDGAGVLAGQAGQVVLYEGRYEKRAAERR